MKFYVRRTFSEAAPNLMAKEYYIDHPACSRVRFRTKDPKVIERAIIGLYPIRFLLMAAQDSKCFWCGKEIARDAVDDSVRATLDHLIPKSRGGHVTWDNCVMACFPCNRVKADGNLHPITKEPIDFKNLVLPLSYETTKFELLEESAVA
jgi:5-methylcytosine-specific restriction endonuclease McrA